MPELDDNHRGVAEVALDGVFLSVNQTFAEMLGYAAQELTGMRVRDVTHPDDRRQSVNIVDRGLRYNEEEVEVFKRYLRRDGTVMWAVLTTTLKRDKNGEPTHFLSFIEDVSPQISGERLPRALTRRLLTVQEEERQRIARELHDELGQVLTALKLELSWLQEQVPANAEPRAARISTVVDGLMASLRQLLHRLRPSILDDLGLIPALDLLVQEVCQRGRVKAELKAPKSIPRLDSESQIALFRICQEGLTNVVRHAQAESVTVNLQIGKQHLTMEVSDDGVGLPPGQPAVSSGLSGIRDRVQLLGGRVEWKPNAPRGTTLMVTLPLHDLVCDERQVPPQWV